MIHRFVHWFCKKYNIGRYSVKCSWCTRIYKFGSISPTQAVDCASEVRTINGKHYIFSHYLSSFDGSVYQVNLMKSWDKYLSEGDLLCDKCLNSIFHSKFLSGFTLYIGEFDIMNPYNLDKVVKWWLVLLVFLCCY